MEFKWLKKVIQTLQNRLLVLLSSRREVSIIATVLIGIAIEYVLFYDQGRFLKQLSDEYYYHIHFLISLLRSVLFLVLCQLAISYSSSLRLKALRIIIVLSIVMDVFSIFSYTLFTLVAYFRYYIPVINHQAIYSYCEIVCLFGGVANVFWVTFKGVAQYSGLFNRFDERVDFFYPSCTARYCSNSGNSSNNYDSFYK